MDWVSEGATGGWSGVAAVGDWLGSVCMVGISGGSAVGGANCGVASSSCNNSPAPAATSSVSSSNNIPAGPVGVGAPCGSGVGACGQLSGWVRGATGVRGVGCVRPAGDRRLPPPSASAGEGGGG